MSVVIVVVLIIFNGHPIPEWPLSITLNSFLAFFTSVAKLALLYPVSEAFGQLRWLRFTEKDRKLSEFETLEQASRGIFGSLKLLGTLKGG